jgi:type II secretory pathway pseudopilin PulG
LTLAELLVATVLVGILGSIVTTAVLMSHKQVRIVDDESTGLMDTRVVIERLGRDIRGSRGVDAGATESNLVLWIDYNSDYVRNATAQAEEIVTWSVTDQDGDTATERYNTLRSTAGGTVQVQARTLVNNLAFCYLSAPEESGGTCLPTPLSVADAETVSLIKVDLQYDAVGGSGTGTRFVTFSERIRNVS